jgi:hypothetical protein
MNDKGVPKGCLYGTGGAKRPPVWKKKGKGTGPLGSVSECCGVCNPPARDRATRNDILLNSQVLLTNAVKRPARARVGLAHYDPQRFAPRAAGNSILPATVRDYPEGCYERSVGTGARLDKTVDTWLLRVIPLDLGFTLRPTVKQRLPSSSGDIAPVGRLPPSDIQASQMRMAAGDGKARQLNHKSHSASSDLWAVKAEAASHITMTGRLPWRTTPAFMTPAPIPGDFYGRR